jgi:hypothetical protein
MAKFVVFGDEKPYVLVNFYSCHDNNDGHYFSSSIHICELFIHFKALRVRDGKRSHNNSISFNVGNHPNHERLTKVRGKFVIYIDENCRESKKVIFLY